MKRISRISRESPPILRSSYNLSDLQRQCAAFCSGAPTKSMKGRIEIVNELIFLELGRSHGIDAIGGAFEGREKARIDLAAAGHLDRK